MWREAGMSIAPPDAEIGWPRVAASFEYHRPLRFEDEFDVYIRVAGLTAKTIRYTCVLEKDGVRFATGALTIACVRKHAGEPVKAIEIPADIASRFALAAEVP
jgi:acyl-CoA thioesterase FadM